MYFKFRLCPACKVAFQKDDFQYHQFHSLQASGYHAIAGETALSLQFHFRHLSVSLCIDICASAHYEGVSK